MGTDLFPRLSYQPLPADARRAGRAISHYEAAHQVWQTQQQCQTDQTLIEMEDDTTLNRPGFDGGTEATGEWASASTEEVPRRAA